MSSNYSGSEQAKRAELLKILYHQQDGYCSYCRRKMHLTLMHNGLQASYEHKIARACGGPTTLENGVASCRRCNNLKALLSDSQFRQAIAAFGGVEGFAAACKRAQMHIAEMKKARRLKVLRITRPELFEPGGFLYEQAVA